MKSCDHNSFSYYCGLFALCAIVLLGGGICTGQDYTGELPPVTIGSPCSDSTVYHWVTTTRAPWEASALIAVPEGYTPEEWDGAESFLQSFAQAVDPQGGLNSMAFALLEVWQTPSARLFVEFRRSVALRNQEVRCVAGVWQSDSEADRSETQMESSDWIGFGEGSLNRSEVTAQTILDALESKLVSANAQPGADTRPRHSFTSGTE